MNQFKDFIKYYFPLSIIVVVFFEYIYAYCRFIKYSGVLSNSLRNESKLLGKIIADYHVLEKGLTMPDSRPGFGVDKARKTLDECLRYKKMYTKNNIQVEQAIAVLDEYISFQESNNFKLPSDFIDSFKELKKKSENKKSSQLQFSSNDYFSKSKASFKEFIISRRSIRNYSNLIVPEEKIREAIALANYSPSSCNRQSIKVYIVSNKELINDLLNLQGGNRGFGHLAQKLLVVVSELGFSHGVFERNLAYVDGGIYVGNLLNGLHFQNIAACPLNCYLSSFKELKIRKLLKMQDSEALIAMVSCGIPPSEFMAAQSLRNGVESTVYER